MVPPLPERKTAKASPLEPPPPDVWTTAEIDAAKARCTAALKGLDAVVDPRGPDQGRAVRYAGADPAVPSGQRRRSRRRADQLRHARAAEHLDHQRSAAARPAPARRQDRQDRGDERLLVPHRLRPRRQEAQPARLCRCTRYSRLRHRQRPGCGRAERLGRHQSRHRRRGSCRQGQGGEARASAGRRRQRATRQPPRRKGGHRRDTGTDGDGIVARHARCRPRQGDALQAASTR